MAAFRCWMDMPFDASADVNFSIIADPVVTLSVAFSAAPADIATKGFSVERGFGRRLALRASAADPHARRCACDGPFGSRRALVASLRRRRGSSLLLPVRFRR
mmetsp:Transcript_26936/g.83804  ORF Transcript_26936/g.83804 Transcript_26936/m.83804 type:complete len:103 (+) Transcript_26936:959-1267(+)